MNETEKTNRIRSQQFFQTYLNGTVIDIGCGSDPVVAHAEPYDLALGDKDAGQILLYRNGGTYDCVYSSHCLEHMGNVPEALRQWWALVKPGGYMILVVPDEDLYEQGVWPSRFNSDHKATFRLHNKPSWSPVSYHLNELVEGLGQTTVISADVQDYGYVYCFKTKGVVHPPANLLSKGAFFLSRFFKNKNTKTNKLLMLLDWLKQGYVDQTLYGALAQIQIVVQKNVSSK